MSYQKAQTTQKEHSRTDHWIIQVNGREWTLSATRYGDSDGSESKPFWYIRETGDDGTSHDGSIDICQPYDDDRTTVKVNWPCRGAQPIDETLRFKHDLSTAIQAATEAEYIINHEA